MSAIRTRILSGFDDPACDPGCWLNLLRQGPTDVVYLTWQWQRAWWDTHGDGELLLVAAEREGRVIAVAPFYFFESGIYFVGAGEAEYTDFIGDCSDPKVLAALIATARAAAPGLEDMKLHLMPETTPTVPRLAEAASLLGLELVLIREHPAADIDLTADAEEVRGAVSRSILEKENYFRRHGELEIRTLTCVDEIRPLLPEFYAQHIRRWERKERPSEFHQAKHRNLLERFLDLAKDTAWIRYLQINWKGRFLAAEFAWHYQSTHFAGPWCFDVAHANHSPGRVLLRHSVLAALAAGLRKYDFGGGLPDANFHLPLRPKMCHVWGLYPP
jgi:CelD/BcsL family acetyltransferase involved in cellulose biosynthesis